jgi:outer membrane protein OmpA-like peptidoglycan-associated protein
MEYSMKKQYIFFAPLVIAILSACNTTPINQSLAEAHNSYNTARTNPQITSLAALELKDAGDTLSKADSAFEKGESIATVNQLSYIAYQQVRIAQETAFRKTDELSVTNASAKRDQVRLAARTAEADSAKHEVAVIQETANIQAAELAAASANAEHDQQIISKQDKQLKELNAKQTKRGLVITIGDVLFNSSKAHLKSGGMHNVRKLSAFLEEYPKYRVLIEGYTDSTGNEESNQMLSEQRADAVKTALIDTGIASDRILTRGYGKEFPVARNNNASNRQQNRRVEIVLSDENGNIAVR